MSNEQLFAALCLIFIFLAVAFYTLAKGQHQIMAALDTIKEFLRRIDAATNDIAARIKKLSDQLANAAGGISGTDAAALATELNREVTALEAMGKEPPPEPPPTPAPPPGPTPPPTP